MYPLYVQNTPLYVQNTPLKIYSKIKDIYYSQNSMMVSFTKINNGIDSDKIYLLNIVNKGESQRIFN